MTTACSRSKCKCASDSAYLLFALFVTSAAVSIANAQTIASVSPPRHRAVTHPTIVSSFDLIDRALASGAIDKETGLTYQIYATFGDCRLPAQFRGDDSEIIEGEGIEAAVASFDTLSPTTRAILAPFLTPPGAPGSWVELDSLCKSGDQEIVEWRNTPQQAIEWGKIPAANGKVKVWYEKRYVGDDLLAMTIASEIDRVIWTRITDLMGEPLSDDSIRDQPNGGDGALDIYLLHIPRKQEALGFFEPYRPGCKKGSGYIEIDSRGQSANIVSILSTVAHELMHAIQYRFDVSEGCLFPEYRWWMEATATWAEDYVYPDFSGERRFAHAYLDNPGLPLETRNRTHEYGAYLFPFYLSHRFSPQMIRSIWDNTTKGFDSLDAIDQAIPGGFERQWPEFVRDNWNRDPVVDYQAWDPLPEPFRQQASRQVGIGVGCCDSLVTFPPSDPLKHLSAHYYYFAVSAERDEATSSVGFFNGDAFRVDQKNIDPFSDEIGFVAEDVPAEQKKGLHIQALIKIRQNWTEEDWTNQPHPFFCRDAKTERLDELVVIVSNSTYKDRNYEIKPAGLPSLIWVSNMGCWQWEGTVETSFTTVEGRVKGTMTANVKWKHSEEDDPGRDDPLVSVSYAPEGTVVRNETGQDLAGCTLTISGIAVPGADGRLQTFNFVPQGKFYRVYTGSAPAGPFRYELACPNQSPLVQPYFTGFGIGIDKTSFVSQDGKRIDGESSEGNASDGYTSTWHFKSIRE